MRVPLPFGYFHLGDCFILLSAVIIGGSHAVAASAVGAAAADMLSGYIIYAPATFLIKALTVITLLLVMHAAPKRMDKKRTAAFIFGAGLAELIMVFGYFLYDSMIYGIAGAAVALPGNLSQGLAAVITSALILTVLQHNHLLKYME